MTEKKTRSRKPKAARTLTKELAALLKKTLIPDLVERATDPAVRAALAKQHATEQRMSRTAQHLDGWIHETIEQIAAAWALSCVFVRTLEDRKLLAEARLAGPNAKDSEERFFRLFPSLTSRDYMLTVFREIASLPSAEMLLGPRHNPIWRLSPSEAGAKALLDFFRETDEGGALRWHFEGTETRFLGDLYQDLSAEVRARFALLQTPHFVESFILDLTLDPAIAEFGLEKIKLIDPTCGSGHFLLGAYDRLFERRLSARPGVDDRQHALDALAQVAGVDLNPYAVAISRFRLTLSFLQKARIDKLASAPTLHLNLAVADSLLSGVRNAARELTESIPGAASWRHEVFDLEDAVDADRILSSEYQAVVANPPYINVDDEVRRAAYRKRYPISCYRTFQLVCPFLERLFQLTANDAFVGAIVGNGFTKREFGRPTIERVLAQKDLSHVIDTSGASIPGHGTPTVIIAGRNRAPTAPTVLAVLRKRGEAGPLEQPENGVVWTSIAKNYANPGFEDDFISVDRVPRSSLAKHPWSLAGGGASELRTLLEERAEVQLKSLVELPIGRGARTGEDEAFFLPFGMRQRLRLADQWCAELLVGEGVRDWESRATGEIIFPYDRGRALKAFSVSDPGSDQVLRHLWPLRPVLSSRGTFQGSMADAGREWFEYMQYTKSAHQRPLSIVFAEVSTHNHFALDRGGRVFKQTAPIIKLGANASEADHFGLLAYLNSSSACFLMKQVCFDKGNRGEGGGLTSEAWEKFYQFDGTKVGKLPCPELESLRPWGSLMDEVARLRTHASPAAAIKRGWKGTTLGALLSESSAASARLEGQMRWLQEELDWEVYRLFGLSSAVVASVPASVADIPERPKGSRPSDVVYSRAVLAGQFTTRYHELCRLPSAAEIIGRQIGARDQERLALTDRVPELRLIESPTYKRTYREGHRPWDPREAVESFLLDRAETCFRNLTEAKSLSFLAEETLKDPMAKDAADVLAAFEIEGSQARDVSALILESSVPFVTARTLTESGLSKHVEWQRAWRQHDGVPDYPPPQFAQADFQRTSYWRNRGRLNVPRECFILYELGGSTRIGWSGWNHLERANALSALFGAQKQEHGSDPVRLAPLLAGIAELVPDLKRWHNDVDTDGNKMGDAFDAFVDEEARRLGLTRATLMTAGHELSASQKLPAKAPTRKKKEATSG